MGHVYLIGETGNDGRYKIGSTRAKKVETRLKQLQTGNPSELYIKESFETDHPFKLEKMLHNHFKSSQLTGEWFELSEADTEAFRGICEDKMKVIESLKDNPYYFNVKVANFGESKNGCVIKKEAIDEFLRRFDAGELICFNLDHPGLFE